MERRKQTSEWTVRKAVQKEGESEAPGTASIQSKTSWFNRRLFAVRILAKKEHASVRCCSYRQAVNNMHLGLVCE